MTVFVANEKIQTLNKKLTFGKYVCHSKLDSLDCSGQIGDTTKYDFFWFCIVLSVDIWKICITTQFSIFQISA